MVTEGPLTEFRIENNLYECYDPVVNTEQIVALLIAERARLDSAINALQGSVKHRGRPPGKKVSAGPVASAAPVARKRRLSAAGRKAIAAAARKRWAAIKAGKAPSPFAKAKGKAAKKS
jgi:hypothetical protein